MKTCDTIAAREPSRYAINGILLESDSAGTRMVATDGRRMSVVKANGLAGNFLGSVILPQRIASLVAKFIDAKREDDIDIFVEEDPTPDGKEPKPATIFG